MAATLTGDEEQLASFPENWFWGNTCETKSWYPMVAAMNDYGRKMRRRRLCAVLPFRCGHGPSNDLRFLELSRRGLA
jgi:hypothetical protein